MRFREEVFRLRGAIWTAFFVAVAVIASPTPDRVMLGIPFVLASLALHRFVVLFNRFKKHIRLFEIITGLFLVVVGLLIFTNGLTLLSQKLTMLMMKLHW